MTPRDAELLSDWLDGALSAEARAALEARFAQEPALAEAARRLRALEVVASTLAPTAEDVETSKRVGASRGAAWWLLGLLVVAAGGGWVVASDGSDDGAAPAVVAVVEPPRGPPHGTRVTFPDAGDPPMQAADAAVLAALLVLTTPDLAVAEGPAPRHVRLDDLEVLDVRAKAASVEPVDLAKVKATSTNVIVRPLRAGRGTVTLELADGGLRRVELVVEASEGPPLQRLLVGATTNVAVPGLVRWSVGDPTVASVEVKSPDAGTLAVTGQRAGSTTLQTWTGGGELRTWVLEVLAAPDRSRSITLFVGSQKVLTLPPFDLSKARVEPEGLVTMRALGKKQLLLAGTKPGVVTLHVSDDAATDYTLTVKPREVEEAPAVTLDPASTAPVRLKEGVPLRLRTPRIERLRATAGDVVDIIPSVEGEASVLTVKPQARGEVEVTIERDGLPVQRLRVIVEP